MSLIAKHVCFEINNRLLIKDVCAEFSPGEFVSIVGENGAGKSTLLNALAGELPVSSGEVMLNSHRLNNFTVEKLAFHRAVLPQNSELTFPLSTIEVVRLALSFSSYPLNAQTKLLTDSLALFDVAHLAKRNYLTLSGGEKQRVQLARVITQLKAHAFNLLGIPQYLLLDEPISALDMHQQFNTLKQLKFLADNGLGVVAILHDLNLAAMVSDRILVLRNGELFAHGTPQDVITQETVQQAFNIHTRVVSHPDTNTPFIIPTLL